MKKIISLIFTLTLLFTIGINAQEQEPLENFKVGDEVYVVDPTALGALNYRVQKIVEISGKSFKIQYTANRFDVYWVTPDNKNFLLRPKAYEEYKVGRELGAKMAEEKKYLDSLSILMGAYNPELRWNTQFGRTPFISDTAAWNKVRSDLAELDQLCKTIYKDVKNYPLSISKTELMGRNEDHCKIAADRVALEKKTLQMNFEWSQGNGLRDAISDIREQMKKGWIHRDFQLLAIDFELWKKEFVIAKSQEAKEQGGTFTDEMLEKYRPIAKELKTFIDNQSASNTWAKPRFADVKAQALATKATANDFVLKNGTTISVGMDEGTWRVYDERNITAVDANFYYYKIERNKNKFKNGRILVKAYGYCQERDFYVKQVRGSTAMSLELLGYLGRFVRCP